MDRLRRVKYCECGCGEQVKNRFVLGHNATSGRKLSEETRLKMSLSSAGVKLDEETKEKIRQSKLGYKHTEAAKDKMSKAVKKRFEDPRNNPNWRGGASFEEYCEIWKNSDYKSDIRNRDGNECKNPDCWLNTKLLSIHHIDYDKKNCHPDNLITLCISCNARANFNRKYWREFYSTLN